MNPSNNDYWVGALSIRFSQVSRVFKLSVGVARSGEMGALFGKLPDDNANRDYWGITRDY